MGDLVSVIMPAYNAEAFINEAIDSVIHQSYQNWELLIIDDESTDQTAAIIKSYQVRDERIVYLLQKKGKQGRARNYGIREARGDFLAFIDADDVWVNSKLDKQLRNIHQHKVDLVFGYAYVIENGERSQRKIGRGLGKYQGERAITFLLYRDAFIMSTVLAKKQAVVDVNLFIEDPGIQFCEDWHLYLKLAYAGSSFYTDGEIVSYYRVSESSVTSVENEANKKFFRALISIDQQYPGEVALRDEILRRINSLVYNSKTIELHLVRMFFVFLRKHDPKAIPEWVFTLLLRINANIFRKLFSLIYYRHS